VSRAGSMTMWMWFGIQQYAMQQRLCRAIVRAA
jgi:hypothetical protein